MANSILRPDEAAALQDSQAKEAILRRRRIVRACIFMPILVACCFATYWALGRLLPSFRPPVPADGWVLDPPEAIRLGLAWYSPVGTVTPFISIWMARERRRDIADGLVVPPESTPLRRLMGVLQWVPSVVLMGVALLAFWFYLHLFSVVGPAGMDVPRRLSRQTYGYERVRAVSVAPARPGATRPEDGPEGTVRFDDGSVLIFGGDDGLGSEQVERLAAEIAGRAGMGVQRAARARR